MPLTHPTTAETKSHIFQRIFQIVGMESFFEILFPINIKPSVKKHPKDPYHNGVRLDHAVHAFRETYLVALSHIVGKMCVLEAFIETRLPDLCLQQLDDGLGAKNETLSKHVFRICVWSNWTTAWEQRMRPMLSYVEDQDYSQTLLQLPNSYKGPHTVDT